MPVEISVAPLSAIAEKVQAADGRAQLAEQAARDSLAAEFERVASELASAAGEVEAGRAASGELCLHVPG